MDVSSRAATPADLDTVVELYGALEKEQLALRPLWDIAEGLADPLRDSLADLLDSTGAMVVVGTLDDVVLGFCVGTVDEMLPQAKGARVGTIRWIYTDPDARGVGIGHAMLTAVMESLSSRGVTYFDSRVSPGHRHAKNFFEAHGFSARLIVMHHNAGNE